MKSLNDMGSDLAVKWLSLISVLKSEQVSKICSMVWQRWEPFIIFHNCEGQSHKTASATNCNHQWPYWLGESDPGRTLERPDWLNSLRLAEALVGRSRAAAAAATAGGRFPAPGGLPGRGKDKITSVIFTNWQGFIVNGNYEPFGLLPAAHLRQKYIITIVWIQNYMPARPIS